jgi:hypothetical protein
MHYFCLSKNPGDRTAQSVDGRGSLMFSSVDRHFLHAHKTQFVKDLNWYFLKKLRVMVDPTFLTPR